MVAIDPLEGQQLIEGEEAVGPGAHGGPGWTDRGHHRAVGTDDSHDRRQSGSRKLLDAGRLGHGAQGREHHPEVHRSLAHRFPHPRYLGRHGYA